MYIATNAFLQRLKFFICMTPAKKDDLCMPIYGLLIYVKSAV